MGALIETSEDLLDELVCGDANIFGVTGMGEVGKKIRVRKRSGDSVASVYCLVSSSPEPTQ